MKLVLLFICLIFFRDVKSQAVETVKLADSLLKSGTFKVATVKYEFSDEIKALQKKSLNALLSNPEWADKYVVIMVRDGQQAIEYRDFYGLSKEEFKKMKQAFEKRKDAILKDTFSLIVSKRNGIITFKANKDLSPFNYLSIDIKNLKIIYDYYVINREVKLEGKHYAPILYGYESFSFDGEVIKGKKKTASVGIAGFAIGKNRNDNRVTMALIMAKSPTEDATIVVTIL